MNKNIAYGVDLAKDLIQICSIKDNKVLHNIEKTSSQFAVWLASIKPSRVIFEACSTSNYWWQQAKSLGHEALLISPRLVSAIRQNQKTDSNDALAIAQASYLPNITFVQGRTQEQQQLQSITRLRELAVKQKTASNNQLLGLLLEFNIKPSARNGGLAGTIQDVLEDGENQFSASLRLALDAAWKLHTHLIETIEHYDNALANLVEQISDCKKLMQLEGVGIINAINLYNIIRPTEDHTFKSGRDVSACIGLTPKQHSSGGKTKIGKIAKQVRKKSVRSQLITGAFTYVNAVCKRKAKSTKDLWIQNLAERKGKKCAAVALANKTVRTAFSLLLNNTMYSVTPVCT